MLSEPSSDAEERSRRRPSGQHPNQGEVRGSQEGGPGPGDADQAAFGRVAHTDQSATEVTGINSV